MTTSISILSSDPVLLEQATRVAREFASQYIRDEVVGIVFLGAIVRGYFDRSSDIDIAIIKKRGSMLPLVGKFLKQDDIEIHCWLSDYEDELITPWDMAKRWTYSQGQIYYDPLGKITRLLEDKVPLKPEEKKWLLLSGFVLSEWYINRLTLLWVERGNLTSAHDMFSQGLNYFFDMLFGLNDQLVPDMKWRYYCLEKLERLPHNFPEMIKDVMTLHAISVEELERRKEAFMGTWREMQPVVENEVQMTFDEMVQLV